MKRVFSSGNVGDSGLFKNRLEEAGIEYVIQNEAAPYQVPGLGPEIWVVHDVDFERACQLRDSLLQPPPPGLALARWTCPGCKEEIEGQFTSCWKCGAMPPAR